MEADVKTAVTEFLKLKGCLVYRQNSGKWQDARTGSWIQGQPSGTPDLLVGIPLEEGIFALGWVELKRQGGGKLSDDQVKFLRNAHKIKCPWIVADCVEDVDRWLKDWSFHGKERFTKDVLEEGARFVPTQTRTRKKQQMSFGTLLEYEAWKTKQSQGS